MSGADLRLAFLKTENMSSEFPLALDRAFLALQKLEAIATELESRKSSGAEAAVARESDVDTNEVVKLRLTVRTLQAENGRLRALVKTAADRVDSAISRLEAHTMD